MRSDKKCYRMYRTQLVNYASNMEATDTAVSTYGLIYPSYTHLPVKYNYIFSFLLIKRDCVYT